MSTIAERIPLFIPPTETDNSAGVSVSCRAVTHRGLVRLRNEDAFCVLSREDRHLFAVADGLGGHRGGSIASEMAISTIKNEFTKWNGKGSDRFATKVIQKANQEVFSTAQSHPELFSMQTTTTVVTLGNNSLTIGHVGDCRLYRVRNGRVAVLTHDHSQAAELLRLHLISMEDALQHPGRHQLTRSVGSSPFLRVDLVKEKTNPGDSYILCSDGLWSEVSNDVIKDALLEKNIENSLEELVGMVLNAGAPDNITGIVFRISEINGVDE
jgi:PPM family protein phosphatase